MAPQPDSPDSSPQELAHRTIAALLQHWSRVPAPEQQRIQPELDRLTQLQDNGQRLTLAAFGLVNRGKSAVLNALLGDPLLEVGPLNGVTRSTHRVHWASEGEQVIDLLDTPGLNEVEGQVRAQLAWTAAQQADLILFVIAGDVSQIEYEALLELRTLQKPILLVFNKIDLYPDHDREAIYAQITSPQLRQLVSPEEILMVAADPKPNRVRIHWPDGRITHDWERPEPQIEPLRAKLRQVLTQEGGSLELPRRAKTAEFELVMSLPNPQVEGIQLQKALVGEHHIIDGGDPVKVVIESVRVEPEGIGAYRYGYKQGLTKPNSITGIIDLGGRDGDCHAI